MTTSAPPSDPSSLPPTVVPDAPRRKTVFGTFPWAASLFAIMTAIYKIISSNFLSTDLAWIDDVESKRLPSFNKMSTPDKQVDLSLEFARLYISYARDGFSFKGLLQPIETARDVHTAKKVVAELRARVRELEAAAIKLDTEARGRSKEDEGPKEEVKLGGKEAVEPDDGGGEGSTDKNHKEIV